tara:strand:+ start:2318 stop:5140 length:2823 start_codon:yes stop_codon:yes gene_type:complete
MAGVTQLIPNYVLGISEQPDELKMPGQVVDLKNGIPDVTRGLIKRPGSKLVSSVTPSSGTLSWFNIYTDSDTQYIGNVNTSGVIQIWRTSDGAVIPIDYSGVTGTNACTYLSGWSNSTDLQPLTVNETTFIANRIKTVAMKTGTSDKSPVAIHEAIVELKTISYGKQYALDVYDPSNTTVTTTKRATSVKVTTSNASIEPTGSGNDGSCSRAGREIVNATASGKANLRYELDVRCVPVVDPDNAGGGDSNTINAVQYNDSYQPYVKLQFGGEGWETGNSHTYNFKGANITTEVTKHVEIKSRATIGGGTCMVRPAATSSTADEAVTAAGILGDLKTAFDAVKPSGMTVTVVGTCLHIKHTSAFNVTTPEPQLMSITTGSANTVGDLPKNCRHNFVVRIANSSELEDDFYLKFKVNNVTDAMAASADRFGLGVWEECPKPNLEIKFDEETMPIKLVRELPGGTYSNGRFLVQNPTWEERTVGDDITNPKPTFVGFKINKLVFFRNRLAVLSEENVILSATNDFFNFWSHTAQAVNDDDPIDLQSSSTFPTTLFDAIEVNSGLLIFSSNQQFMLTTDSDAFTPKTAKINYLSAYNFNHLTKPFSLGITSGFLNSTGKNARFYEMADVRREGEPNILEQSKVVSKLLPIDLNQVAASKENGIVLFGSDNKSEVWGYRYFNTEARRVQSAWFRWELPGNLIYHTILDDVYYTILKNGSNYTLEAFDVKEQDTTFTVGTSPEEYIIHLDCHSTVSSLASNKYDSATKLTTFPKPAGYNSSKQLAVYDNNTGNNIGRYDEATVSGSNLTVPGDWTGVNFVLGYQYDWEVELPTIFPTKAEGDKTRSDTRASLIVHRLNLSFGNVGLIDVTLKRKGRADYTQSAESADWGTYLASRLPIATEYIHTIPAYERNTNLTVILKSSNPFPSSLHSMNWEGDFSNKFYKRV